MIALKWTESGDFGQSALDRRRARAVRHDADASAAVASTIVNRSRSGATTEIWTRGTTDGRDRPPRADRADAGDDGIAIVDDDIVVVDEPRSLRSAWEHDNVVAERRGGVSSLALTWLVYERLTPLSGGLGFLVRVVGRLRGR